MGERVPGVRPGLVGRIKAPCILAMFYEPCDWSPVRDDCAAQWRARCVVSRMQQSLAARVAMFHRHVRRCRLPAEHQRSTYSHEPITRLLLHWSVLALYRTKHKTRRGTDGLVSSLRPFEASGAMSSNHPPVKGGLAHVSRKPLRCFRIFHFQTGRFCVRGGRLRLYRGRNRFGRHDIPHRG